MAYDSDTRVKETLKDISRKAKLKNLELRIYDESNEDQKHWTNDGLTFGSTELLYGSNDAGWFFRSPYFLNDKKISEYTPIIIVEGSYGTETGNTGSAQYARFSHALGAVKEGFIGVYFVPFVSIYRKSDGSEITARVRCEMIYAALNASEKEKGEYLFIDAYNEDLLKDFLEILDRGNHEEIQNKICKIKKIMKIFADKYILDNRMVYLYNKDRVGKLLMFNVVSFSSHNFRTNEKYKAGRFRNGHTILGTGLINLYWHSKPLDLVLARFTHEDCKELDNLHQKEWLLLRKTKDINIITLDDLEFKNNELQSNLYDFLDELPLLGGKLKKKNLLAKSVIQGFKHGMIKVNYKKVEQNEFK